MYDSTIGCRPRSRSSHAVQDLRLADDLLRVHHQVAQQGELGRREIDHPSGPPHLVGVLVQGQVGVREDAVVDRQRVRRRMVRSRSSTSSMLNGFVT